MTEAHRANAPGLEQAMIGREARVRALVHGQDPRHLSALAGMRMIRHPNLIHAAVAPDPPAQRRALTAWYCPAYVSPCYTEIERVRVHVHNEMEFSSGAYPDLDPLD